MQKYTNSVADFAGRPVANASVTVTVNGTGALATIYSDNGINPANNPLTTDANGEFSFYAADGRYNLAISGSGVTATSITDIQLNDYTDDLASDIYFTQPSDDAVSRSVQAKLEESISVKDFNAAGDGATDDTAAIQAALDYAAALITTDDVTGYDAFGASVFLPPGCYRISSPLTIPRGVKLYGTGRRNSMILLTSDFTGTYAVSLGELGVDAFAFGSAIESLALNLNFRADVIGVVSDHAAEGSGMKDVLVRGTFRPVRLYKTLGITSPNTPTELLIEECEFWLEGSGGPAAPRYAIDIDDCDQSIVVRHVTVFDLNTNMGAGSAAIRVNECAVQIEHVHSERMERCLLITGSGGGSSRVFADHIEHYNGSAQYGVYIDSTAGNANTYIQVRDVFVGGTGTVYAIQDAVNSKALSDTTISRALQYDFIGSSVPSLVKATQLQVGSSMSIYRVINSSQSIDFPSINAGANNTQTLTVTGAKLGDTVIVNVSGSTNIYNVGGGCILIFSGGVSATDTISVRAHNIGTSAGDAASLTFDVTVIGFAP